MLITALSRNHCATCAESTLYGYNQCLACGTPRPFCDPPRQVERALVLKAAHYLPVAQRPKHKRPKARVTK